MKTRGEKKTSEKLNPGRSAIVKDIRAFLFIREVFELFLSLFYVHKCCSIFLPATNVHMCRKSVKPTNNRDFILQLEINFSF